MNENLFINPVVSDSLNGALQIPNERMEELCKKLGEAYINSDTKSAAVYIISREVNTPAELFMMGMMLAQTVEPPSPVPTDEPSED